MFELWLNGKKLSKDEVIKVEWQSAPAPTQPQKQAGGVEYVSSQPIAAGTPFNYNVKMLNE